MEIERLTIDGNQIFYACQNTLRDLKTKGNYEPIVTDFVKGYLKGDMIFADVGAHVGYYTLIAAKRARRVLAFEPHGTFRRILLRNIKANRYRNVTVSKVALFSSRSRGKVTDNGLLRIGPGPIRTATLDECLAGAPMHLIKIDVEGAEFDVLLGAKCTLQKYGPALVLELHLTLMSAHFGHSLKDLLNFLAELGYVARSLTDHTGRAAGDGDVNLHLIAEKG